MELLVENMILQNYTLEYFIYRVTYFLIIVFKPNIKK